MATKFEPELGEAPPTKEERAKAEKFLKEARRTKRERREKADRAPGEVPPKPITEKFPGEAPPYPAGYTPPEGKVVEFDAKGRPTVIVTSAGLRQYTPNATMFKMGYVTSDQYAKSGVARGDKFVAATAFLPITSEKGEALMIDKEVAFALQDKKPREQFNAMQEMGIIETGSRFVAADDGEWSYQTARSVKREGEVIKKSAIFEQYDQKLQVSLDFKKGHIELPDGQWVSIKDWNELKPEIQKIGLRQGFAAMNNAMLKDSKDFRAVNTQLPDGTWFDNADLMGIRTSSPELYDILTKKGFGAYQGAITDAKSSLEDYYDPQKDSYNVIRALLTRKPELTEAVEILFNQTDIDRIRYEYMPGLTIGTYDKKKEVFKKAIPGVAVAGVFVTASPVPFDDIIFYAALTGFGIWAGLTVKDMIQEYKSSTGRAPTPADIVVVDKKGKAATALQLLPELQRFPGLIPPPFEIAGETIKPKQVDFQEAFKKFDLPLYREGIKTMMPEVVFLPTPATTIEDVTKTRAGFMAAQAAVAVAEVELKSKTEDVVRDLPPNLRFLLEPSDGAEDIMIPRRDIATWTDNPPVFPADKPRQVSASLYEQKKAHWEKEMARITSLQPNADIRRSYDIAFQDYLRRLAIYANAKQQFIASVNPQPIMGTANPQTLAVYSEYLIDQLGREKAKPLVKGYTAALERSVTQAFTKAYTKALTEGQTATQAQTKAKLATNRFVAQAVKDVAKAQSLTKTQTKTLARTLTRTVARTAARPATAVRTAVIPGTAARTAQAMAGAAVVPATAKVPLKPLLIPLPRAGQDKKNRERILRAKGAIGWRQGALAGKPIYHVLMWPYASQSDYVMVFGRKPTGASVATGKGSAYRTIKRLTGKGPGKTVKLDMGIQDVAISPRGQGVGIKFSPDPKQETTGDITITRRPPPLDRGRGGIGRRPPRITPKTPRLRR